LARLPYAEVPEVLGITKVQRRMNVIRMLFQAPTVAEPYLRAGRQLLTSTLLSPRLRELVIVRVAHLQASPYELAQHEPVARQLGITDSELASLRCDADLGAVGFESTELAALLLVTEMLTEKNAVDHTFAQAHRLLGDRATAEVLLLAAQYAGLALFLNTLRVDVEDDVESQGLVATFKG
jgi:4-carboxymuconolactone decarboxylase